MYTRRAFVGAWPVLRAALVACSLFAGSVGAKDVTVAVPVSTQGLDLSQPAGAQKLYWRLLRLRGWPARMATGSAWPPPMTRRVAVRRRSADAIRAADLPLLTQAYLATHTVGKPRHTGWTCLQ